MTTSDPHEQHEPLTVGQWPGPRSDAMAAQLRWVHDMLRRDLVTLQRLAARVADGAAATDVKAELETLRTSGPLFQLRVNCLNYCRILESHHGGEDAILFPAIRRAAPQLAAAVDRLEADHRVVAVLLGHIEQLTHDLSGTSPRSALVEALEDLSSNLSRHLDFEEATLQPVLESWSSRPEDAPTEIRDEMARRAR
jgi:iron-sulfur cluster repair protein YtfE (RIC family)